MVFSLFLFAGTGKFHILLLLLCGWAVSSDAVEVLSVSFLLPSATCDLNLSSVDKGWLNAMVFVGKVLLNQLKSTVDHFIAQICNPWNQIGRAD